VSAQTLPQQACPAAQHPPLQAESPVPQVRQSVLAALQPLGQLTVLATQAPAELQPAAFVLTLLVHDCAAPQAKSTGRFEQVPVELEQTAHTPQGEPVFFQAPLASQVCGCAPLQVFAPGLHTPVHRPLLHTFAQAEAVFCQAPAAEQVCG
jgi:hypothetical protein